MVRRWCVVILVAAQMNAQILVIRTPILRLGINVSLKWFISCDVYAFWTASCFGVDDEMSVALVTRLPCDRFTIVVCSCWTPSFGASCLFGWDGCWWWSFCIRSVIFSNDEMSDIVCGCVATGGDGRDVGPLADAPAIDTGVTASWCVSIWSWAKTVSICFNLVIFEQPTTKSDVWSSLRWTSTKQKR